MSQTEEPIDVIDKLKPEEKRLLLMALLEDPEIDLIVWDEASSTLLDTDRDTVCLNGPAVQIQTVPHT